MSGFVFFKSNNFISKSNPNWRWCQCRTLTYDKKKTIANIMLWWIIRECSCN